MKLALISDTHSRHENIYVFKSGDSLEKQETLNHITRGVYLPEEADMIIHAGDISMGGTEYEIEKFLTWYSKLPYKYKIFIAGNHDWLFDIQRPIAKELLAKFPDIIYLENELLEVEGLKIWGSPIQPWFHSWAFNKARGADIKKYWDAIPDDTEILVTHGPPYEILDMTYRGGVVGCVDLMNRIKELKSLKLHCWGHIHEDAGKLEKDGVLFANASVLNLNYQLQNKPIIVEVDENKTFKFI